MFWEPTAAYLSNPLYVYDDAANLSLALADPSTDLDQDSLPDWWEYHWFSGTNQAAGGDYDEDGLTNIVEFDYLANPTDGDTDGDDIGDALEVAARTDPTNDDTAAPSIGILRPAGDGYEIWTP